jgi:hypothetical protein
VWLVQVTGDVFRKGGVLGGELQVPVQYYESAGKTKKTKQKNADHSVRTKYLMKATRSDRSLEPEFPVDNLLVGVTLNALAGSTQTISFESLKTLNHWTKRLWEGAVADIAAGDERPGSLQDKKKRKKT